MRVRLCVRVSEGRGRFFFSFLLYSGVKDVDLAREELDSHEDAESIEAFRVLKKDIRECYGDVQEKVVWVR